jgi:hypothetical protein
LQDYKGMMPGFGQETRRKMTMKEAIDIIWMLGKLLLAGGTVVGLGATYKAQTDMLVAEVKELKRDMKSMQINLALVCGSIKNCKMEKFERKVREE